MINPFELIEERLSSIENLLLELKQSSNPSTPEPDRWFDLNELVAYDPEKRSKATFYRYTRERTIPFHKGGKGRKLTFLKSEVDLWIKQGRRKTIAEISAEADSIIKKRGLK